MPTIDMEYKELEQLLNVQLNGDMEKLDDILAYVKAEVKGYNKQDQTVNIEFKDTNRPDLWSVEGLARALRGYLSQQKGLTQYCVNKSAVEVFVSKELYNVRPYIACAVIKEIHLSDAIIRGLMHLQEKLDQTFGRSRQKTSIGIYNLDLIKPPIEYTAVKPNEVTFVPLGFTEQMGLNEILEKHPKGCEYGHIVKKNPMYPMLFDADGKVLSFPPIINSNDLGKVTEESRNLLVEVTGTLHKAVLNALNLVVTMLIDRGGKAYTTTIHYPDNSEYTEKNVVTPNFSNRCVTLSVEYTNKVLGLGLTAKHIAELLKVAGLGIDKITDNEVSVLVPCYRTDVMHQVDLIEDVAVAYGYNNITPNWRELPTIGREKPDQHLINLARDLMIGLGYQETLNTTLTNQENLYDKMAVERKPLVELSNPKIVTMTCLRNWLMPGLMEFLSINQSVEFPQKIYELGKVTHPDQTRETKVKEEEWLTAVTTHPTAGFSEIKSALDSFFANFGVEWQIKETIHPSFIEGRAGKVIVDGEEIGIIGEVSPQVLENWKLENPAAAFEINLQAILNKKLKL
ncbi:MAG: phenylalanine--tRNA ligase subunit beta [Candidatus Bathyarchaeia archaeon]|jgi:phenylalanyl-tRNA synthetase beta chain